MKSGRPPTDNHNMLLLLVLLTAGYFAGLVWTRRLRRSRGSAAAPAAGLPQADRPPASAVGWPPQGSRFERYVDEGVAALDAYLEDGYAA